MLFQSHQRDSSDAHQLLEWLMMTIHFPQELFGSTFCKQSLFLPSYYCSLQKFCCIWPENHKWKCSLLNYFLLNCEAPKHHNLHVQVLLNDLQCLYHRWSISAMPHVMYSISINGTHLFCCLCSNFYFPKIKRASNDKTASHFLLLSLFMYIFISVMCNEIRCSKML